MSLLQIVVISCVSLIFVAQVNAATFIIPPNPHPEHPDMCWNPDLNETIAVGQSVTGGNCIRYTCHQDLSIGGASCGKKLVVLDNFECKELPIDLSQDYPHCCPKIQCVDENGALLVF
ncbi:hypothetical protein DMENIID0001_033420 [Sergentomyia squamirostris]